MEVSGQFHAATVLLPGEKRPYSSRRRLCGTEHRSGRCGKEKNILHLLEIETLFLCSPASKLATITITLSLVADTVCAYYIALTFTNTKNRPMCEYPAPYSQRTDGILYKGYLRICNENFTKHINTLCEQNTQLLILRQEGTYSNHSV
jgi:hypothetical protein